MHLPYSERVKNMVRYKEYKLTCDACSCRGNTNVFKLSNLVLLFISRRNVGYVSAVSCSSKKVWHFLSVESPGACPIDHLMKKLACSVTSTIMTTQELSATDLQDILHFTIYLARKAGNLILEGSKEIQKAGSSIGEKSNAVDLVTKYDVAVEELVKKEIAEQYSHFEL